MEIIQQCKVTIPKSYYKVGKPGRYNIGHSRPHIVLFHSYEMPTLRRSIRTGRRLWLPGDNMVTVMVFLVAFIKYPKARFW